MRGLSTLVRRELRELRALWLVSAALAPLGTLALLAAVTRHLHGTWNAVIALPVLVTLFALAATADLYSADARSGRLMTLAHLPVRAGSVWLAKLLAAALAIAAFAAWSFAVQLACLARSGGEAPARFHEALPQLAPWLPLLPALVAATALWSAVRVGGLAAATLGAMTVGAPLGLALWLCARWSVPVRGDVLAAAVLGASVILLASSAGVLIRGRLHLGDRCRPLLLGPGSALLVLLPIGLVAAGGGRAYLSPALGNPRMHAVALCASPDGTSVAVLARHSAESGWNPRHDGTWLVATDGAAQWSTEELSLWFLGYSDDGLALFQDLDEDLLLVDPRTATMAPLADVSPRSRRRRFGSSRWASVERAEPGDSESDWVLHLRSTGRDVVLAAGARPDPQVLREGIVLRDEPDGIQIVDLEAGSTRGIPGTAGHRTHLREALSPDGRFVLTYAEGERFALAVDDGRVVLGPLSGRASWLVAEGGDALLLSEEPNALALRQAVRARVRFVGSNREVELGALSARLGEAATSAALLRGERFAVLRPDGSVELLDEAGATLRVLLAADGER